jgi:hypothetical protein
MARRKIVKGKGRGLDEFAGQYGIVRMKSGAAVHRVSIDSRDLIVVRVGDVFPANSSKLEGAIVWVEVPPSATAEEVEAYRLNLLDYGVLGVRILPRGRGDDVVPMSVETEQVEVPTAGDLRSVALELVEEAATSDRPLLREVVGRALDEAGL